MVCLISVSLNSFICIHFVIKFQSFSLSSIASISAHTQKACLIVGCAITAASFNSYIFSLWNIFTLCFCFFTQILFSVIHCFLFLLSLLVCLLVKLVLVSFLKHALYIVVVTICEEVIVFTVTFEFLFFVSRYNYVCLWPCAILCMFTCMMKTKSVNYAQQKCNGK